MVIDNFTLLYFIFFEGRESKGTQAMQISKGKVSLNDWCVFQDVGLENIFFYLLFLLLCLQHFSQFGLEVPFLSFSYFPFLTTKTFIFLIAFFIIFFFFIDNFLLFILILFDNILFFRRANNILDKF